MKSKFQINEFTGFICKVSENDKDLIVALNRVILQGLKDFQSKRYRQFFLLFEKSISFKDGLQQLRLQGFRSLQEGLILN